VHGSKATPPPIPIRGSRHSVAVGHSEAGHRVQNPARELHLHALASQGATPDQGIHLHDASGSRAMHQRPSPAVPSGLEQDFSIIFSYFGCYNLLGPPAGVVPVTRVRPDETHGPDRFDRRAAAVAQRSEGLPAAVQVVGSAGREDIVLAVMTAVEDHAHMSELFPRTPLDPVQRHDAG
jgi:hypothetical protein